MRQQILMLGASMFAFGALLCAAEVPHEVEAVHATVNAIRAQAGLAPLVLDPVLSEGCMQHARYMVANRGTPAMAGLNAHHQRPDLPYASKAGAQCAVKAVLAQGDADLPAALRAWMASLYHRRPFLSPRVRSMGLGFAPLPDGGIASALTLPEDAAFVSSRWPVLWPVDGQVNVPLQFGSELPNPIPGGGNGGYPITLFFPDEKPVAITTASLRANGQDVPVWLSSPAAPVTEFSRYGVVSLIPKEPLLPATTYDVTIVTELAGQSSTVTGRFTTVRLVEVPADNAAAMSSAVGVASRIAGRVTHGGRMSDGTVYLQLASSENAERVFVLVPPELWRGMTGNADPLSWRARRVLVDATPERVGKGALNLAVGTARQLRAVEGN